LIERATSNKVTYSFIAAKPEEGIEPNQPRRTLFMYTGVIGGSIPDNIAVSVTYCCKRRVTVAVIYGCTAEQKSDVFKLLGGCEGSKNHPYLVIGTFAELQLKAISKYVKGITYDWELFELSKLNHTDYSDAQIKSLNSKLREYRVKIKKAESEVQLTQRYVRSTIDHLNSLLPDPATYHPNGLDQEWLQDMEEKTTRFKKRFAELDGLYDDEIVRCRTTAEEMAYSAQQVRTHATNRSKILPLIATDVDFSSRLSFLGSKQNPATRRLK
jgi:hypothetical protein